MSAVAGVLLAAGKFWILDPLYIVLGTVLAWFYGIIPSFGVSIILLTATVSLLRMPLVAKQVKSQQEMQRIQPELKRIQAKYKTEPQKRNEELMKLYKEHNVNPFAGCLPLVLQMPLFIVLYRLILNLSHQPPKHIPRASELFQALTASHGKMRSFGMDLAQSASKVHGAKLLPYAVLIAVVVGTGLFQQRQMTARLPKDAVNTQVQVMGKIFPVFLGFISFSIPAGVVLYFFVSNLWQIGQQAFLFRNQPVGGGAPAPKPPRAQKAEKAGKPDEGDKGEGETEKPVASDGASGGGGSEGGSAGGEGGRRGASGGGKAAGRGGSGGGGGGGGGAGGGGKPASGAKPVSGARGSAPRGTRGPGGAVGKGPAGGAKPSGGGARGGAAKPPAGSSKSGSGGGKGSAAAPASGGGFFARLLRGGGSSNGKSNGKANGKAAGRTAGAGGKSPGNRSGPNGRATPPRNSGRAQGKGQTNPRSKPRNTRKGK